MVMVKVSESDGVASPPCLEFANTVRWHKRERPEETIHTYTDLVTWARKTALVSDRQARILLRVADQQQTESIEALERALALREAIYRIFVALIHGKSPAEADLAELNGAFTKATSGGRVVKTAHGFAWAWNVNEDALDSLILPIAISAVELLISNERQRVGQCADDRGCGWLFLDTSKNHSRRWCDINDCGNRAKQRRHNERERRLKQADMGHDYSADLPLLILASKLGI